MEKQLSDSSHERQSIFWPCVRPSKEGKGSLVVLLLAQRAR
jgi:hypothetical protein